MQPSDQRTVEGELGDLLGPRAPRRPVGLVIDDPHRVGGDRQPVDPARNLDRLALGALSNRKGTHLCVGIRVGLKRAGIDYALARSGKSLARLSSR